MLPQNNNEPITNIVNQFKQFNCNFLLLIMLFISVMLNLLFRIAVIGNELSDLNKTMKEILSNMNDVDDTV